MENGRYKKYRELRRLVIKEIGRRNRGERKKKEKTKKNFKEEGNKK